MQLSHGMNRLRFVVGFSCVTLVATAVVLATQPIGYTFQCDGNCAGQSVRCASSSETSCCNAVAGTNPVQYQCVCCKLEENDPSR